MGAHPWSGILFLCFLSLCLGRFCRFCLVSSFFLSPDSSFRFFFACRSSSFCRPSPRLSPGYPHTPQGTHVSAAVLIRTLVRWFGCARSGHGGCLPRASRGRRQAGNTPRPVNTIRHMYRVDLTGRGRPHTPTPQCTSRAAQAWCGAGTQGISRSKFASGRLYAPPTA